MAADLEKWAPTTAQRLTALPSEIRRVLQDLALDAEVMAKNLARKRSGQLARSIRGEVRGLSVSLTASAPYARIHEEGGIVRGRPWLTVPLREDVRRGPSARQDSNLFVVRLKDGRLFLGSKQGSRLDLRWRLVRQVAIPPRPYLRPALDRLLRELPGEMARVFDRTMAGGADGR